MVNNDGTNGVLSILVEEEEAIRQSWLVHFAERNMRLLVFESAEAFLAGFTPNGERVEFFFDQDFGQKRGVGITLAQIVRNWPGRLGTSLVTAHLPEDFRSELASGLIDAVQPKFPEGIFGVDFYQEHIRRQLREKGFEKFMADSLGRMREAFDQFDSANRSASQMSERSS